MKPRIFILKFCNLQQENKMEDILQKILKEASSEKFAHISVKAHKANGETTSNRFQQQRWHLFDNSTDHFNAGQKYGTVNSEQQRFNYYGKNRKKKYSSKKLENATKQILNTNI